MKATKNQAAAVRSYLSTLGVNISHVQALEVIARGEGHRSRHVKASTPAQPSVPQELATEAPVDTFAQAVALCEARGNLSGIGPLVRQLRALFPELFTSDARAQEFIDDDADESVHLHCETLRLANAIRAQYFAEACTQAAQGEALLQLMSNCGEIFCDYRSAYTFLSGTLVAPSSAHAEPAAARVDNQGERSDCIKAEYLSSGCQRSDLEEALSRLLAECGDLFESEESAMAFLMEVNEMDVAQQIKAEYDNSRCHADDVDHAVSRLMAECPSLFSDDRKAWSFINEETHEELEVGHVVQVESEVFGNEVFTYFSEEELRAGLVRLMAKAVELNDGVERSYYVSEIDSDIEKNTPEYSEALQSRELEGHITAEGMVHYQGEEIGLIKDLTEGGLTLYSWIDENP